MVNKLAGETSPYLLQHAHNPVDWQPWGPLALAQAKHVDRVMRGVLGKRRHAARAQRRVEVEARCHATELGLRPRTHIVAPMVHGANSSSP